MKHDFNKLVLGRKIYRLRSEAGMTSADLARKVGRDQSTISRIENGQRNIGIDLLYDLGRALNVSPLALLTDEYNDKSDKKSSGLVGPALKHSRESGNITLAEAAEKLKISAQDLTSIENSLSLPPTQLLECMCDYYNLCPEYMKEIRILEENRSSIPLRLSKIFGTLNECIDLTGDMGCNDSRLRNVKNRLLYCLNQGSGK